MQRGNLSNRLEPSILFTWEHLLAEVAPGQEKREQRMVEKGRWKKALDCWREDPHMRQVLADIVWRKGYTVEVLTYYPPPFAVLLKEQLNDMRYPFSYVTCGWPKDTFASQLAAMPWVVVVYHPEQSYIYGTRGQPCDPGKYTGADL